MFAGPAGPGGLAFGSLFLTFYHVKMCQTQQTGIGVQWYIPTPANIQLLGTSFQKARRAFWGEARPGFGVHGCVYKNKNKNNFIETYSKITVD